MKKTLCITALALISSCALVSCGGDDDITPQQPTNNDTSTKYSYVIAAQVSRVKMDENLTEFHTNLYPIYQEYKKLIEEVTTKYSTPYTVEIDNDAYTFMDKEKTAADTLAKQQAMTAKMKEAMAYVQQRAAAIKTKLTKVVPSEYEKYTAKIVNGITVKLVRDKGDVFESTIEAHDIEVLSFNGDAYTTKEYDLRLTHTTQSYSDVTLNEATTPNAFNAFAEARNIMVRALPDVYAATNEGNGSDTEKIVIADIKTPADSVNEIAKKVMAKRIQALEQWAKNTAKDTFMANFRTGTIPQAEIDKLDYNYHVAPALYTPYYVCPKCGYTTLNMREDGHKGCDETTLGTMKIYIGEGFDLDVFRKK